MPAALASAALGVLRHRDTAGVYVQPWAEFRLLAARGALRRLAPGYSAVVPPQHTSSGTWIPALEAAAYGIGAADYGPDDAALMGLSAARLLGVLPRAHPVAVVAVPKQRAPLVLSDRPARVIFVRRGVSRLDVARAPTELGSALVTTPEQTVLDLAHRPELGGLPDEARACVAALWPRTDQDLLAELAGAQRMRAALSRARSWSVAPGHSRRSHARRHVAN